MQKQGKKEGDRKYHCIIAVKHDGQEVRGKLRMENLLASSSFPTKPGN